MLELARRVGPWEEIRFVEAGWDRHQDVYALALPTTTGDRPGSV
jgi:hypothetical protein